MRGIQSAATRDRVPPVRGRQDLGDGARDDLAAMERHPPASRAFYERLGLAPEAEDPAYPTFELELMPPHWKARPADARLEEAEPARGRMA
jgi:hypothetical protein